MDLLQEYEKSQPKATLPSAVQTQEQLLRQRYTPDTGFFIKLVMKLSGGRIQDARRASWVLLAAAGVILVISLFIFFRGALVPSFQDIPVPLAGSISGQ